MSLTMKEKLKLKKFIKELKSHRAPHTEFVTVLIPSGYDIIKVIGQLQDEQGTASNIKSASTRKNVQDALERKTPPNGLAAYSGNTAAAEGKSNVEVWSIEPPIPINQRIYRCDKTFLTDVLEKMIEDKSVYGLIVMDRRDADIALLKGKSIIHLVSTHSHVPGKFRAGGQSAMRFHRLIEGAAKEHYKKVGEYVKEQFLNREHLKGIIIGGPGPTKYTFAEGNFITDQVKRKIIGIKDLSYTGDFGLQELVDKSQDLLASEAIAEEKAIMQAFFTLLATDSSKVAYGKEHVEKALKMGAVERLILSEKVDEDVAEELSNTAEEFKSDIKLISNETREGKQLEGMGGIVAILRFPIEA